MSHNFIYCSNCGTRNFVDDQECGVCKRKLNKSTVPKEQTDLAALKASNLSIGKWILGLLIAVVGYYLFFNESNQHPKPIITNSSYDASVSQVEKYVKENYLTDSGSYEAISWSAVVKLNDTKELGFSSYQVRHKFRANNAYGGKVVEEKVFKMDYQGNITDVKEWIK